MARIAHDLSKAKMWYGNPEQRRMANSADDVQLWSTFMIGIISISMP